MAAALAAERAAESARRDLFTAVSHDLRTPLAAVQAIVESIDDGVVTERETIERYFGQLKRNVEVLASLVDDLFELARLEGADFMSDLGGARVGDVVAAAVRSASAQAASKDVTLRVELDRAGGYTCSPRLVRVLHNLLQNAITHSPEGSVVTVAGGRVDGRMQISVCDEGEGMAPEDAARAFEPFYRADPARHGPGAGLGLALVERIITGLGGAVELETARGTGSRFTIDLPRAASRQENRKIGSVGS
jgi:two-component system sensor histidine kinase SaeS